VSNWQGILDWANAIDTNNITVEQGGEINSKAHAVERWLEEDGVISSGESGGNKTSLFFGPTNPLTSSLIGGQTSQNLNEIELISMTDELYKVTIPTLVLWGKYDFVVPPSLGHDTFNNISSADKKIVIFDESAHSPMSNEWRKYTDEMIEFIELYK
jgi:pimeloyl-ACP methyl ester carboxylesterase